MDRPLINSLVTGRNLAQDQIGVLFILYIADKRCPAFSRDFGRLLLICSSLSPSSTCWMRTALPLPSRTEQLLFAPSPPLHLPDLLPVLHMKHVALWASSDGRCFRLTSKNCSPDLLMKALRTLRTQRIQLCDAGETQLHRRTFNARLLEAHVQALHLRAPQ